MRSIIILFIDIFSSIFHKCNTGTSHLSTKKRTSNGKTNNRYLVLPVGLCREQCRVWPVGVDARI